MAILLFIFGFIANLEVFDCIACWELQKVKITLYNNQIKEGFIPWNPIWVESSDPFPRQVCDYHASQNKGLILYKKITLFKNQVFSKSPINIGKPDTINTSTINYIEAIKDPFNGLIGAGFIPNVTEKSALLLRKDPITKYSTPYSLSDLYILSYNEDYTLEDLIQISKEDFNLKQSEYEEKGIIILDFPYD